MFSVLFSQFNTEIPMFKVTSIEVVALVLRILWTDPLVRSWFVHYGQILFYEQDVELDI